MRKTLCVVAFLAACSSSAKTPGPAPAVPVQDPGADPALPATADAVMVENLVQLQWSKLGNPVVRWDAIPTVAATKAKPHRLLVVLVEFSDYRFERFRGQAKRGDKLAQHYHQQLFDPDYAREGSLSHYYNQQSGGTYHVDGIVLPPVKLPKPRRAYGGPNRPAGGDWRNDGDTEGMVEAALKLASKSAAKFPAEEFDRWDPIDHDGDGVTDEADGYLDHFVIVYAGGPQNTCQSLNKIGQALNANVGNKAIRKLDKRQRECADRLWPHRSAVRLREGQGPKIGDGNHRRGGVPVSDSLWVYDYNMQSEYTDAATFIHEFGHSIGLPDVYSRTSNNSTGSWSVMSADTRPNPQGMSAWSRLQLGWLKPTVVRPPAYGGKASGSIPLARLDDQSASASRAIMVVLPPKKKALELTDTLPKGSKRALYGGQGNELSNTAERTIDLTEFSKAQVSFDAWWEIEAGWDFAYIEVSADGGKIWKRQLPVDRKMMPAKHGHDGKKTVPGFTGLSGDLDGDGKNESATGCDPKVEIKSGEDKAGAATNPCLAPSWVRPAFDLTPFVGNGDLRFRVRHYTDGAAVMRGILIDNVLLSGEAEAAPASNELGTFEADEPDWRVVGFSPSPGRHDILVPHYYLIEYRDPYKTESYDKHLADSSIALYPDGDEMRAVEVRRRPGVVVWYADGAYAWSENDPAINGPGKGYALVVDSTPNEIALPGLDAFLKGKAAAYDTHYDVKGAEAQKQLKEDFKKSVCFVRSPKYFPRGVKMRCRSRKPPIANVSIDGKTARYSYEVSDLLPGPERDALRSVGELVDTRTRKGVLSYRLRDRALRHFHTYDAPFSTSAFADGVIIYRVTAKGLEKISSTPHPANPRFDDSTSARWLNPKMPFGGVNLPPAGFSFEVVEAPGDGGAVAEIRYKFGGSK